MFQNLLLVLLGGGIGSVCRYLIAKSATQWFGSSFAWGTLGVNLGGCLLIGFSFALAERSIISPQIRLITMTGFLGGLTTFSTFALETINFANNYSLNLTLMNIALNNAGGLFLVIIGIWLGRLI